MVTGSSDPPRTTRRWVGEIITLAVICSLAIGPGYLGVGPIDAFQTGLKYLSLGLLAMVLFVSVAIWRRPTARTRPGPSETDGSPHAQVSATRANTNSMATAPGASVSTKQHDPIGRRRGHDLLFEHLLIPRKPCAAFD